MRAAFVLVMGLSCAIARSLSSRQSTGGWPVPAPSLPQDFSWIQNWAAVGDSFVAGIGAGNLWSDTDDSETCSRYDQSYPALLNQIFPNVREFQYPACSGATSQEIYQQINTLSPTQDLIVLGAGGNDLCLSSIIFTCILSSVTSGSACQALLDTAQTFIEVSLGYNIGVLIDNAVSKLNHNGVLIVSQYAQYFDVTSALPCLSQDWTFPFPLIPGGSNYLTQENRQIYNQLVNNTNLVIAQAVENAQTRWPQHFIDTAAWDDWVGDIQGRFCNPDSSPYPSDPSNDNVQFFKLNTAAIPDNLRKRASDIIANVTANGANQPQALPDNSSVLFPRDGAPRAPACPKQQTPIGLPDRVGSIFHPNELGHLTIASYVSDAIIRQRSKQVGFVNPDCIAQNNFQCYQDQGSHQYASPLSLYQNTEDFCNLVSDYQPSGGNQRDWSYSKLYFDNTPDASLWTVSLAGGWNGVPYSLCHNAVNRILDSCDGNDPKNPMNWKFGGYWQDGGFTFSIAPQATNRPWPVPSSPQSACGLINHGGEDITLNIQGTGWSDWDFGAGRNPTSQALGGGIIGNLSEYFQVVMDQYVYFTYNQGPNRFEWGLTGSIPKSTFLNGGNDNRFCHPGTAIENAGGGFTSCTISTGGT